MGILILPANLVHRVAQIGRGRARAPIHSQADHSCRLLMMSLAAL